MVTVASSALMCAGTPVRVGAHGAPPDITFWGGFPEGTVSCLRRFGRAIRHCVDESLAAHRKCLDAQLAGAPCDAPARDERISAAISAGRASVARLCTGGQLTELRFINPDDARTDVTKTCTEQPQAVISVAYAPVLTSGGTAGPDADVRQCVMQTATYSRKLLRRIVRVQTRVLDRIAVNLFGPSQKTALLRRAAARIASARDKLAGKLVEACPNFEAIYGRSAAATLGALAPVGDCVVGAAYVQTSIACPLAVCGNGVKESPETCDDGNTIDDDRCRNDCTGP